MANEGNPGANGGNVGTFDPVKGFLRGGWVFLMTAMILSFLIWLIGAAKDTGPFTAVLQFGIPAWFAVNAIERAVESRK